MARNGHFNPMQEHHRKSRQKELQKNKQKRMKERDEKAIQTKTAREVKEEIQKLEKDMKRHNGQQQKSNAEHKLARLKKELKLIQDAEAAAKAKADVQREAERLANQYRQPQRPRTELDDPRKSIYYDEKMNPFGAPPPGKPRLYHRRFGGVTPNIHEAVVPGEEPQLPPPPRHDRSGHQGQSSSHHQHRGTHNYHQQRQPHQNRRPHPQKEEEEGSSAQPPSSKRQPLHMPPHKQSSHENKEEAGTRQIDPPTKTANKPTDSVLEMIGVDATHQGKSSASAQATSTDTQPKPKQASNSPPVIPSLPAPSQAVQRTLRVARNKNKKAGALADIWASTEEVEYEKHTNQVDLEADDLGTAKVKHVKKKKKKKNKLPLEFYYRDNTGAVQGPYTKAQMRGWIDAGYFPPTTKARTNRMDPDGWVAMGELPALQAPAEATSVTKTNNDNVQDRIAALKGDVEKDDDLGDSSMQARIAAMRADLLASSGKSNDKDDSETDTVQDRIAALKGTKNDDDDINNTIGGDDANIDDNDVDPSMQSRIAAMKADLLASSASSHQHHQKSDDTGSVSLQERIAALRNNAPPPPPIPTPTYPVDNDNENDMGPSAYPLDTDDDAGAVAYPVDIDNDDGATTYPIDNDDGDEVAPYPMDTYGYEAGVAAYPMDDDDRNAVAPYSLNDEDPVASYPTNDAYSGAEDLAYPVTDSYPVDGGDVVHDSASYEVPGASTRTQKVVKVDKALVSFVPTNVKKRKTDCEDGRKDEKKPKLEAKNLSSENESSAYDKFMGEIDGL